MRPSGPVAALCTKRAICKGAGVPEAEEVPAHVPAWHASAWVHALPSLQGIPSRAGGFVHCPVAGSQVPAVWHWSSAMQTTPAHGSPPVLLEQVVPPPPLPVPVPALPPVPVAAAPAPPSPVPEPVVALPPVPSISVPPGT